jgi:hypothetical protein
MIKKEDVKWLDDLLESTTGESLQKKIERAQQEAQHAQQEAQQTQQLLEEANTKCYFERQWKEAEIAGLFGLDVANVRAILDKKRK